MKLILSEQQIFQQYRDAGVLRGGELYLVPKVALDLVASCEDNDLAVVGIEGFTLRHETLMPQTGLIADWSSASAATWDEYRMKCNQLSATFIKPLSGDADLVLSLTVLSNRG